jgi:hypothetical protein
MTIEAGVVVGRDGEEAVYWHLPPNRNVVALPDSRDLWDVFWENRDRISGFAHSHPGLGVPGPSWEDLTTFAAVEGGLGRRLKWWITSMNAVSVLTWKGPGKYDYELTVLDKEPSWIPELRRLSQNESTPNEEQIR